MKRLYILRHAQALPNSPNGDFGRELSPKGHSDALALGQYLKIKNYNVDAVLCSPATRTKQTLENLNTNSHNTALIKDIYEAGTMTIFGHIQDLDDTYNSAIIIGHNPMIYELALRLSSEDSGESLLQRLNEGYKPATLTVLDCPCQVWNDVQIGENTLIDLVDPLDYNAPSTPARWT